MKKLVLAIAVIVFVSCQNEKEKPAEQKVISDTAAKEKEAALPDFAYPVLRSHWKMGDPQNTKMVLDMYRAWDNKDAAAVASYYADSADLDLPHGKRIKLSKGDVYQKWARLRNMYDSTQNMIIAAYTLHNEDFGDDWVMILTYNKWTYKNGARDSSLYFDNWRLKDGKIAYLNALEHTPSAPMQKRLEGK